MPTNCVLDQTELDIRLLINPSPVQRSTYFLCGLDSDSPEVWVQGSSVMAEFWVYKALIPRNLHEAAVVSPHLLHSRSSPLPSLENQTYHTEKQVTSHAMQSHFFPPDGGLSGFDYGVANVTIETLPGDATSAPSDTYLAFFPSGLGVLGMITHLLTHPKIKDWLQLILLGFAAEFTRRLSAYLLVWAREIFCITSVHATSDDSYDWLMGKYQTLVYRVSLTMAADTAYWMQDKRWKERCRKL